MKKLILILVILVILPAAVIADFGIGGAAFLKSPVLVGQPIDTDNLNVHQFSLGGDLRFRAVWLWTSRFCAWLLEPARTLPSISTRFPRFRPD